MGEFLGLGIELRTFTPWLIKRLIKIFVTFFSSLPMHPDTVGVLSDLNLLARFPWIRFISSFPKMKVETFWDNWYFLENMSLTLTKMSKFYMRGFCVQYIALNVKNAPVCRFKVFSSLKEKILSVEVCNRLKTSKKWIWLEVPLASFPRVCFTSSFLQMTVKWTKSPSWVRFWSKICVSCASKWVTK